MYRSRKALLTLIALALLIALAYFLSPLADGKSGMRYVDIADAGRRGQFILEPEAEGGTAFSIELYVEGELSGEAVIRLEPPSGEVRVRQRLRAGQIDARYEGDWYAEACTLVYEPEPGTEGTLRVYFQFDYLE